MSALNIDRFMYAIREIESGHRYNIRGPQTRHGQARGAYQILDKNWSSWAREAGIAGANWRDPRAQDRVARHKMLQYYRTYGSWDAVAVAWFAGPSRAQRFVAGDQSVGRLSDQLGTSVSRYLSRIRTAMTKAPPVQANRPEDRPGAGVMSDALNRLRDRIQQLTAAGTYPGYQPSTTRPWHLLDTEWMVELARRAAQPEPTEKDPEPKSVLQDPTYGSVTSPQNVYPTFLDAFAHFFRTQGQHDIPDDDLDMGDGVDSPYESLNTPEGMLAMLLQQMSGLQSGSGPVMPVAGVQQSDLSQNFGASRDGGSRSHKGLDIFAPQGTPVLASVGGKIARAGNDGGRGGIRVWVEADDGRAYYYAHLASANVQVGDTVQAGQQLGTVGTTGNARGTPPHLHFSINSRVGPENPVMDPYKFLTGAGVTPVSADEIQWTDMSMLGASESNFPQPPVPLPSVEGPTVSPSVAPRNPSQRPSPPATGAHSQMRI